MEKQQKQNILFRGATIISMDPKLGILHDHDVLIEGNTISKVATDIDVGGISDLLEVDARTSIIAPGFIDGHHHLWQQLLRSLTTDWSLADYFVNMRLCYGSLFTPEDVYLADYTACMDLLNHGVTTVIDHCHILNSPAHADAAIKALKDSNIRGAFCYGFYENPKLGEEFAALDAVQPDFVSTAKVEDAKRARKEHFPNNDWESNLITFGIAPTEAETMPFDQLKQEIELARSLQATVITAHVAMGHYDLHNNTVQKLQHAGLLGADMLFSHGASFTDAECDALAQTKGGIVSTPDTDLQMGMGHCIAFHASDRGCRVGLGIDITSNQSNDMLAQMRTLLQAQRSLDNAAVGGPPVSIKRKTLDVLRMATLGGAEAVGIDHLVGSITPGKRADLIVVKCDDLSMVPVIEPVGTLVFNANASNIDMVLVDGRIVKKGGKVLNDKDWEGKRAEIRRHTTRLLNGAKTVQPNPDVAGFMEALAKRNSRGPEIEHV